MRCTAYHVEASKSGFEICASSPETWFAEIIRQPLASSVRLGDSANAKPSATNREARHNSTASVRFMRIPSSQQIRTKASAQIESGAGPEQQSGIQIPVSQTLWC